MIVFYIQAECATQGGGGHGPLSVTLSCSTKDTVCPRVWDGIPIGKCLPGLRDEFPSDLPDSGQVQALRICQRAILQRLGEV